MASTVTPAKNFSSAIISVTGTAIGGSSTPNTSAGIAVGQANQAELYVTYTEAGGGITSMSLMVEVSQDNSNWFAKTILDIADGSASSANWQFPVYKAEYQIATSGSYVIDMPTSHNWMRVKVWGTGTPTTGDTIVVSLGSGAI